MSMLKILNEYKSKGWLISQTHPTLPLTIWNYSRTTEYDGRWDEITTQCRGLVTDDETGEIVARPFRKFWNMEEKKHKATKTFEVFEKLDGSLIIAFWYKEQWVIASKGSFISDQCETAAKMINDSAELIHGMGVLDKRNTYLWEVIYTENRVVVTYDFEGLVLLAAFNTKSGNEISYNDLIEYSYFFKIVKRYDGILDFDILKNTISDNEEGRVIRFSNGQRMKVKGEEYFRLHKIMTDVSTTAIWEYLKDGSSMEELLGNVPDEFFNTITNYINETKYNYMVCSEIIGKLFDGYLESVNYDEISPKVFSKFVNLQDKAVQGVLWRMYYKRDYSEIIWRIIKPEFKKL